MNSGEGEEKKKNLHVVYRIVRDVIPIADMRGRFLHADKMRLTFSIDQCYNAKVIPANEMSTGPDPFQIHTAFSKNK